MPYNTYAYVTNHFNIMNSKRLKHITILKTRKSLALVNSLRRYNIISSFILLNRGPKDRTFIRFTSAYSGFTPYFSAIRLVSTPSKAHTISLQSLRLVNKSVGSSLVFLETSKGIMTHKEALRLGVSGRILAVVL